MNGPEGGPQRHRPRAQQAREIDREGTEAKAEAGQELAVALVDVRQHRLYRRTRQRAQPLAELIDETARRTAEIGIARPVERCQPPRSEEHTSELQSLMRTAYAVFCLKTK